MPPRAKIKVFEDWLGISDEELAAIFRELASEPLAQCAWCGCSITHYTTHYCAWCGFKNPHFDQEAFLKVSDGITLAELQRMECNLGHPVAGRFFTEAANLHYCDLCGARIATHNA